MKKNVLPYCLALCLILSCSNARKHHQATNAFYFWKTEFILNAEDKQYLKQLHVQKLYIRFFDLEWDQSRKKVVVSPWLKVPALKVPVDFNIIPVVFITPSALKNIPIAQLEKLAARLCKRTWTLLGEIHAPEVKEMQIDCDWNSSLKKKYFILLRHLGQQIQEKKQRIELSITIRLHQLMDPEGTGIPPVDRGMLMVYNLLPVHHDSSWNAILELSLLKEYLSKARRYPLHLDLALPIFSWAAHFNQDHHFLGLISDVRNEDLSSRTGFQKAGPNIYTVMKTVYFNNIKLLPGDRIRVDEITFKECLKAARYLKKKRASFMQNPDYTISLFYFDPGIIDRFTLHEPMRMEKIFRVLGED